MPWIAPRPELPLIGAAVAWCVLAGIGFDAAASRLRARAFGLPHLVAGIAGIVLLVQIAASAGWIARGDHPGLVASGGLIPSFLAEQAAQKGPFRVAWVDGTLDAPRVALSGPAGQTMLQFLQRPAGAAATDLRRTFAAIASDETESGGRLLATFGVQYVIVRPTADRPRAFATVQSRDRVRERGGSPDRDDRFDARVDASVGLELRCRRRRGSLASGGPRSLANRRHRVSRERGAHCERAPPCGRLLAVVARACRWEASHTAALVRLGNPLRPRAQPEPHRGDVVGPALASRCARARAPSGHRRGDPLVATRRARAR